MLNIKRFEEVLNIENTTERCDRVITEVQPVLNGLIRDFINNYSAEDETLKEYELHSYESTLRTAYSDSINPKYSEIRKNTSIGTKDFSMIYKKFNNNVELCILGLTVYGKEKTIRIGMEADFYYYWQALREKALEPIINSFGEDIRIAFLDSFSEEIPKDKFIETVQNISKSKKRPWIFVGFEIPFDNITSDTDMLLHLWKAWQELKNLRIFNLDNAYKQSRTLGILDLLKDYNENFNIDIYGHSYEVKLEEIQKCKSRAGHWQKYLIEENGQQITNGFISYYKYNNGYLPIELVDVDVNGLNQISTTPRVLLGTDKTEWFVRKSFHKHDQDNGELLRKALEVLKVNNIKVKDNTYYIASFDNNTFSFVESLRDVKENILKAALIFADISGVINLSKEKLKEADAMKETLDADTSVTGEETNYPDTYVSNFDLLEIIKLIEDSKFTFSKDTIRDLHLNLTALGDKHFVILNGISGTGKTQICRLYANAVYGLNYEEQNSYLRVIPVRPDWTDSTALFGYYSAIQKKYVMTEFLETVLNAMKEREKPYFIVLDEMNLARVEYYLSDYLSAVESRKPIRLHSEEEIENIPKEIIIPPNIYIIGTVNVDETTYSISDKVLDRAFVMTLSDVDLETYWSSQDQERNRNLEKEFKVLVSLHKILKPYELHFGYRSMDEMTSKLNANINLPEELQCDRRIALDRVICEKVLPKIRGDERIENLLNELIQWAEENFSDESESLKHFSRMKGELERYGATQFWR